MGAMKSLLMDIEDTIWEAIEAGAKTKEDIYAFVFAKHGHISTNTVYSLIDAVSDWPGDQELYQMTATTFH